MTRCEVCLHLFSKMYICHDVEVKPHLQTLTGEVANSSDKARLDVSARNFLAKVFNPFTKSHLNQKLDTTLSSNENDNKKYYNQRIIEVAHDYLSPLLQRNRANSFRTSPEAI
ncbi:unnamed protein product [Pocillopora meandrina]|uniref:Uncharacterized protein n=1 Tax=Pocillopora meandrina TaxID=46732 RepID=A0AAU9VY38_9CNID|nr:unnamed protein product [Pocillopora meandrina]